MATKGIAYELLIPFSRVGIPQQILTDRGTPFMSRIMKGILNIWIKHLSVSPPERWIGRKIKSGLKTDDGKCDGGGWKKLRQATPLPDLDP